MSSARLRTWYLYSSGYRLADRMMGGYVVQGLE